MKLLKIFLVALVGFLIGVAIYHPKSVNESVQGNIRMQRLDEGFNAVLAGSSVIGYSCTSNQCYALTR
jgi:hypothetical protein